MAGVACRPPAKFSEGLDTSDSLDQTGTVFVDAALPTGLLFSHFNGFSGRYHMPEIVGAGGALFDFDGDGDLDIFLVQGAPVGGPQASPGGNSGSRLFRNEMPLNGRLPRFVDATPSSGISDLGVGMGVAVGDFDNDGDVDLYTTAYGPNKLWRNEGHGRFTDVTGTLEVQDERWSTSASFSDVDGDGWLDLIVANYVDFRVADGRVCTKSGGQPDYCGPRAYSGVADSLFLNSGGTAFVDRSGVAGFLSAPGPGLGVVVADLDSDGRADIFIANDESPNRLWLGGEAGRFVDFSLLSGTAVNIDGLTEASMGIGVGDFDGDADLDLLLSHLDGETNTLYVNEGQGFFSDGTGPSALGSPSRPFTGFGVVFLDFDNDGWLDVAIANGAVFVIEAQRRRQEALPFRQSNQLFRNTGGGAFEDWSDKAGPSFAIPEVSRGLASGDIDNDGDTDLLLTNNGGPARLLLNQIGNRNGWLGVRLVTGSPLRDDIGATVTLIRSDGLVLFRRVHTDGSYLTASDPRVLLGLGDSQPAAITVRWSDGTSEEWSGLERRRYHVLSKGSGAPKP